MHRHQQSYQRQDCGDDLPSGDARQRVLEAHQDFAQAGSIRYRRPIGPWSTGPFAPTRRTTKSAEEPIGEPISYHSVGFRVAKVAVGGRFGSNGLEVSQPRRAGVGRGRLRPDIYVRFAQYLAQSR